jgi:signal transduction histidine kinase/CheY-like chemotaxis protein
MSTRTQAETAASFESELQLSPTPVLAILLGLGVTVFFGTQLLAYPFEVVQQASSFLLLLELLSVSGYLLARWKPLVGRWFTILATALVAHALGVSLGLPGGLALAAVPVALAAPLISFPAALVTAAGESAIVLASVFHPALDAQPAEGAVALALIWVVFGAMSASYRPLHQLGLWLEEYHDRARQLLEEARDRKAELEQALAATAHANRQLALANERTSALRTIAEEAEKAKTAFVARVSHEFRTPLNMIVGMVDLMVERPDIYDIVPTPKMREDLQVIYENCEHLSHMINDVLDLTRMEAGFLTLLREWTDLRETIADSVTTIRPLLTAKNLSIAVSIPSELSPVYCDPVRIQQVILNLLSNAGRFTEHGGITLEVVQRENDLLITVADTGTGIAPSDLQRIFEPFSQGADEVWRDKGGSGLGLTISRQFVRLHGGQMWAESELGHGTRFSLTLPTVLPVEHIVRPGHQIREDWVWHEGSFRADQAVSSHEAGQRRVLVYDETGELCAMAGRYEREIEFVNARDLPQLTQELGRCPAHAIIVNGMPDEDLWQRVAEVTREAPHTPVIGCAVPRVTGRALSAGATGYLVKPVTRADLQAAIQGLQKPIKRVLVVDDDADALRLFVRMLRACDETLDVVTASNGQDAVDELRYCPPDLMLLDIMMPDMDGWQVLETVRQDSRLAGVPTFIISARDPSDQPLMSPLLLATIGDGWPLGQLLRCSLEISAMLLTPATAPDPVLE